MGMNGRTRRALEIRSSVHLGVRWLAVLGFCAGLVWPAGEINAQAPGQLSPMAFAISPNVGYSSWPGERRTGPTAGLEIELRAGTALVPVARFSSFTMVDYLCEAIDPSPCTSRTWSAHGGARFYPQRLVTGPVHPHVFVGAGVFKSELKADELEPSAMLIIGADVGVHTRTLVFAEVGYETTVVRRGLERDVVQVLAGLRFLIGSLTTTP